MPISCQDTPGLKYADPDMNEPSFMSQTAGVPLVFCHKRSAMASPLKSAASTTCHDVPGLSPAAAPDTNCVPSMYQITTWPLSFCQTMSDLPSASKSLAPFTCHVVPGLDPTPAPLE